MKRAEALIDFLNRAQAPDGARVTGWRLALAASESVRVGLRNSELGGPYEGAGAALTLGAALEIHWSDGRLSRPTLDRRAIIDPSNQLAEWRETAVAPRGGRLPPLAELTSLPQVEVFDPLIADAVSDDPSTLLRLTVAMHHASARGGALRTDAGVRASQTRRIVATSRGFRAEWRETYCSVRVWADELGGASYERRRLPTPGQIEALGAEAATLSGQLRQPDMLPAGARGVLFAPSAVEQLIGRFFLPNLAGRSIRDGRSAFSWADLDAHRQVARDGFSLRIDTTLPFAPASAPCSSDGVPAGRVALIADGRLVAPIVDLESAADLGYPPTPRPAGRPHALLALTEPPLGWDAALAELGAGVIVRDLPGLHTQAARRADYALVTPEAQAVENGRAGGRCAVRLAGNAIDHVSQPSSRLVRAAGAPDSGLLVMNGVTILPA